MLFVKPVSDSWTAGADRPDPWSLHIQRHRKVVIIFTNINLYAHMHKHTSAPCVQRAKQLCCITYLL